MIFPKNFLIWCDSRSEGGKQWRKYICRYARVRQNVCLSPWFWHTYTVTSAELPPSRRYDGPSCCARNFSLSLSVYRASGVNSKLNETYPAEIWPTVFVLLMSTVTSWWSKLLVITIGVQKGKSAMHTATKRMHICPILMEGSIAGDCLVRLELWQKDIKFSVCELILHESNNCYFCVRLRFVLHFG